MNLTKREVRLSTAVVATLLVSAGLATALHVSTIVAAPTDLVDLWFGHSDFTVQSYSTSYTGKNRIHVDVTVKNAGATSASTSVTVKGFDGTGALLKSQTLSTNNVAPRGTVTLSFTLDDPQIVDKVKKTEIVVN